MRAVLRREGSLQATAPVIEGSETRAGLPGFAVPPADGTTVTIDLDKDTFEISPALKAP